MAVCVFWIAIILLANNYCYVCPHFIKSAFLVASLISITFYYISHKKDFIKDTETEEFEEEYELLPFEETEEKNEDVYELFRSEIIDDKNITLGIVGGGTGGLEIMKIFSRLHNISIKYVVDLDNNAPAMVYANNHEIATYTDLEHILENIQVNFIIEATGAVPVMKLIDEKVSNKQKVIYNSGAFFLYNSFKELFSMVSNDIHDIKDKIEDSVNLINPLLEEIGHHSQYLKMISINALVEVAHIGERGKGFAVVANEIKSASEKFRDISSDIAALNTDNQAVIQNIDRSLSHFEA